MSSCFCLILAPFNVTALSREHLAWPKRRGVITHAPSPAFALVFGFPTCSAIRMLTEFSRQGHVTLRNIFQSISSGPGYALRRQPGGPERGGSSQPGWSCRGRRSYGLFFDPSPYTHAPAKSCAKLAEDVLAAWLKPPMSPALRSGSGLQRAS